MSVKYAPMSTVEAFISDSVQEQKEENVLIGIFISRNKEYQQVVHAIHASGQSWALFTMGKASFSRHGELPDKIFGVTGNSNVLNVIVPEGIGTFDDETPEYYFGLLGLRKDGPCTVVTSMDPDGNVHDLATITNEGLMLESYVMPAAGVPLTSKRQMRFG